MQNGLSDEKQKSVPETAEGAAAMLQSAIRHCIAAGLTVRASNVEGHGLVVSVLEFARTESGIVVKPAAPAEVTA